MVRLLGGGLLLLLLLFTVVSDRPFARQDALFETTLVGVVVPDDVQPGDTVMGTVTLDPAKYEGVPGLRVIAAEIPAPSSSLTGNIVEIAAPSADPQQSGQLTGMIVDIPKDTAEAKKRGNLGKIFLKAAEAGATQLPLLFRRQGGQPIATRNIPIQAAGNAAPLETFEMPAVIGSNDVPVISGPIGKRPQVAIGEVPTEVVAAGPRTVAFEVPEHVSSGTQAVRLTDSPPVSMTDNAVSTTPSTGRPVTTGGATGTSTRVPSTTMPATATPPPSGIPAPGTGATPGTQGRSVVFDEVTVVGIGLKADGPTKAVSRGTETPIEASITGTIPATLFARPLPQDSRYLLRIPYRALKGAPRPGDRGKIGILIENRSPGTVRLEGERNGAIVKWFDQGDIERGQTSVKSKIIAQRVGGYNVRARVMPMVPPAQGKIAPGTANPQAR